MTSENNFCGALLVPTHRQFPISFLPCFSAHYFRYSSRSNIILSRFSSTVDWVLSFFETTRALKNDEQVLRLRDFLIDIFILRSVSEQKNYVKSVFYKFVE